MRCWRWCMSMRWRRSRQGPVSATVSRCNEDVFAATRWRWEIAQMLPSEVRVTMANTHGNLYTAIQLSRDLIGLILFIVIFVAAFNVVSS